VNTATQPPTVYLLRIEPALLGTACCLLSALCYTAANVCLRQLAEQEIDSAWVICVKEIISVAVVGPWLLWRFMHGERFHIPWSALAVLAFAGLVVQLAGNLAMQWAFGVVGLAVSMPLVFGVNLTASGLIGMALFRELLSVRSVVAILLVIAAVTLLSVGAAGASESSESLPGASSALVVLLGLGAACLAGAVFAGLGAAIRHTAKAKVPVAVTIVMVTGVGVVVLGTISALRLGSEGMLATEPLTLAWMIASGVFNLVGFALIIKGLQLTTLVHANVLNASQVALGAAAGILLFHESHNLWLLSGILLTVIGIAIFDRPVKR
jgi:drug/metabolite transporter, DME family